MINEQHENEGPGIAGFDELLEQRRAEKKEALRFARAGLGVHDSELVYADDPRLAEWAKRMPGYEP